MAELMKIKSAEEEFRKKYFYRNREAEENRQRETRAVIRIQSWFRACKVRAYLSHLHKKAVIIQKIWRGFTARACVRQMVKAAYFIMKMNFYEEMAVRIQRRWRGFFVRKYIHDFYARKKYLERLLINNELMSPLHSSLTCVPSKDIHERRAAMMEIEQACPVFTFCFCVSVYIYINFLHFFLSDLLWVQTGSFPHFKSICIISICL
ncbi:spermatogenesis-associated protein 17 isoform X4 [Kryptolebias marmoratus]|uniref:spermatogenesis-associated protein 17 isoform X4 n=1 Tax=Kryptolebias marmoratus TaxID=37003 RepID=UPI0018ACBF73|nr:spermatogenesis-associated protein 17 isoform X4 [Kryptolebias marmoratus]